MDKSLNYPHGTREQYLNRDRFTITVVDSTDIYIDVQLKLNSKNDPRITSIMYSSISDLDRIYITVKEKLKNGNYAETSNGKLIHDLYIDGSIIPTFIPANNFEDGDWPKRPVVSEASVLNKDKIKRVNKQKINQFTITIMGDNLLTKRASRFNKKKEYPKYPGSQTIKLVARTNKDNYLISNVYSILDEGRYIINILRDHLLKGYFIETEEGVLIKYLFVEGAIVSVFHPCNDNLTNWWPGFNRPILKKSKSIYDIVKAFR